MAIPVDPMVPNFANMDLDSLAQMLMGDQQAAAQAEALKRQLTRADDMTKTNYSQIKGDPYGYQSLFGGVRDVLSNVQGTRQQQRLEPQLEDAQGRMGMGKTNFELYKQKVAQDAAAAKALQEQAKAEALAKHRADQNALKQATLDQSAEQFSAEAAYGKTPTEYTDPNGTRQTVLFTAEGYPYTVQNGEKTFVDLQGWKTVAPPSRGGTKNLTGTERRTYERNRGVLGTIKDIAGTVNTLSAEEKEQLDSVTKKVGQWISLRLTPAEFSAKIKSVWGDFSPKVRSMMSRIAKMNAKDRHELFGATLTGRELESEGEFTTNINDIGLTGAMIRLRDRAREAQDWFRTYREAGWIDEPSEGLQELLDFDYMANMYVPGDDDMGLLLQVIPAEKHAAFNAQPDKEKQELLSLYMSGHLTAEEIANASY